MSARFDWRHVQHAAAQQPAIERVACPFCVGLLGSCHLCKKQRTVDYHDALKSMSTINVPKLGCSCNVCHSLRAQRKAHG